MDEMEFDPILKNQKGIPISGIEYSFVNLPRVTVETVSAHIHLLWIKKGYNKKVKPEEIIYNIQKVFSDKDIRLKDKFWREKSAASLRELVDGHFQPNCNEIFKGLPQRHNGGEEERISKTLQDIKYLLNDIAHFKKINKFQEKSKEILKRIINDDQRFKKIQEGKEEINDLIFDQICTEFILLLERYFSFGKK